MTVRNREIKAVSPIIINAGDEQKAQEIVAEFEKIVKKYEGVKVADLFKESDTTYVIQFGFTNVDMYQKYLNEVREGGLL